jgi:hypothetical protein
MSYSLVTAIGGGPFITVLCPDSGELASADDIRRVAEVMLANDGLLTTNANSRLLRAGDTSTGLQTFAAGATVSPGQDLTLDGASVQGVVGFSTLGRVWLAGRKQLWRTRATLSDTDQAVNVDQGDRFTVPALNAAPRTITLTSTGVVPETGETLTFFWNPGTAGGGGTQYTFIRADLTVIATFVGAQVADTGAMFAEFEFTTGIGWRLGKHSGTPNEYVPPVPGPESWDSYGVVPGAGA